NTAYEVETDWSSDVCSSDLETSVEQGECAAEIPGRLVGDRPDPLECAERETGQLENQPLRAAALDAGRWRRGHVAPHAGHMQAARVKAACHPETLVAHRPDPRSQSRGHVEFDRVPRRIRAAGNLRHR